MVQTPASGPPAKFRSCTSRHTLYLNRFARSNDHRVRCLASSNHHKLQQAHQPAIGLALAYKARSVSTPPARPDCRQTPATTFRACCKVLCGVKQCLLIGLWLATRPAGTCIAPAKARGSSPSSLHVSAEPSSGASSNVFTRCLRVACAAPVVVYFWLGKPDTCRAARVRDPMLGFHGDPVADKHAGWLQYVISLF